MQFDEALLSGCIRKDAFYIIGGIICPAPTQIPSGDGGAQTVYAVNLGSFESFADSYGITHTPDINDYTSSYEWGVSQAFSNKPDDIPIYSSYFTETVRMPEIRCMEYNTNVDRDGSYELIMKIIEDEYEQIGERVMVHIFIPTYA